MNQSNPTPYAVVNGELLPEGQAGFPVYHQSLVDSFGIYETVKVENGRFFHLAWHLRRLGQSAEIIGLDLPASLDDIGQWARELVATSAGFGLLRIVAYGTDGVHPPVCGLYMKPQPRIPAEYLERGIQVVTSEGERFHPLAKSTNCLAQAMARFKAQRLGAHEGLIVDRFGHITEGSTSNLLVACSGELMRPLPGTALEGVTEGIVLELAGQLGIPVRTTALPLAEAKTWDEAFITSSNRRIIPIRQIDDTPLPASPGPLTQRLMEAFRAYEDAQGWE
jgi:branched-subunit amino acid aminotransferase/4-amino-4-deoxychorismate lyase